MPKNNLNVENKSQDSVIPIIFAILGFIGVLAAAFYMTFILPDKIISFELHNTDFNPVSYEHFTIKYDHGSARGHTIEYTEITDSKGQNIRVSRSDFIQYLYDNNTQKLKPLSYKLPVIKINTDNNTSFYCVPKIIIDNKTLYYQEYNLGIFSFENKQSLKGVILPYPTKEKDLVGLKLNHVYGSLNCRLQYKY